jgi:hypothetical protein
VVAGLVTALLIVTMVHCQKRLCQWAGCREARPDCCETDSCQKYRGGALTSARGSPLEQGLEGGLYYTGGRREDTQDMLAELYYPSSTKSTYCQDDYFLTLAKDGKTFKPIRVCEL